MKDRWEVERLCIRHEQGCETELRDHTPSVDDSFQTSIQLLVGNHISSQAAPSADTIEAIAKILQ